MKKGAIIFAFNNDIDYKKIATQCAIRIKKFLKLPVSIITDDPLGLSEDIFDKIILSNVDDKNFKRFYDGSTQNKKLVWKNSSRHTVYDLTPYDETLVVDADYFVNSDFLKICFNLDKDFLIYKESFDLSERENSSEFKNLNQYSIPFYWATVFYFKKTEFNETFFYFVSHIKENWNYYRLLYQITEKKFRNDYAFSIAIHVLHGFDKNLFDGIIPGKLFYTTDRDILIDIHDNSFLFLTEKKNCLGEYTFSKIKNADIHIMNKFSLERAI